MVTMNIVRAGFKLAPTKNKKDIKKKLSKLVLMKMGKRNIYRVIL